MSKGRQTTASTRTFMAPSEPPKKPSKKLAIRKPKIKTSKVSVIAPKLAWLLIVVLAAGCVFMYFQYRTAQGKIDGAKTGQSAQAKDVIKSISKIAIVPTNETPTVATVTDVEKVKDQAFFTDAKNGDKVLVYAKQKKAILYRPGTNQIVNINTVTTAQGVNQAN